MGAAGAVMSRRLFVPEDLLDRAAELSASFDWLGWDARIAEQGTTIDRPKGSVHPDFPHVIYPIDYGYVNGTMSTDGEEMDVFLGTAEARRLVGIELCRDVRKSADEIRLVYACTRSEVYLVHGFMNFAPTRLQCVFAPRPQRVVSSAEDILGASSRDPLGGTELQ